MKKEIGKYVAIVLGIICVILAIALISIRVSSVSAHTKEEDLKEKIGEEIKYLDSNIIDAMNKINNISVIKYKVYTKEINQSQNKNDSSNSDKSNESEDSSKEESSSQSQDNGNSNSSESQESSNSVPLSQLVPNVTLQENNEETNWEEVSFLIENMYSTWPAINLDLQKQGISNEIINSFSLSLDGVIQSVKNKDKNNTLVNLLNMYINLPKYSLSIAEDSFTQNKYNVKLNILNAYTLISNNDNWNNAVDSITSAKSFFSNIISTEDLNEDKKNSMQKIYLSIEDLERITQINDKEIFFMGYKNVMQELETL